MKSEGSRPILVTGAGSGIGNYLVKYLAARGHIAYAGVRSEADFVALAEIDRVVPIRLDVRDIDQVRDAEAFVRRQGIGLYGLVNNAGLGELGMLSTWNDDELVNIFDVNVFGPFRMTNAFLGLLLKSEGRVVNIGSQGGVITSKYYGPYTMTKHALEAYTVTLNYELEPYHVRASIVQPGGIATDIGAKSMAGSVARFKRAEAPFVEEADQVLAALEAAPEATTDEESETNRKPSSPEIVATAVYEALFSERPKIRYLVGTTWEGNRVLNALLAQLLDENDNPQHNYSRDQLVALLDRHILRRRDQK